MIFPTTFSIICLASGEQAGRSLSELTRTQTAEASRAVCRFIGIISQKPTS